MDLEKINKAKKTLEKLKQSQKLQNIYDLDNAIYIGDIIDFGRIKEYTLLLEKQLYLVQDLNGKDQVISDDLKVYGNIDNGKFVENDANINQNVFDQINLLLEDEQLNKFAQSDKIEEKIKKHQKLQDGREVKEIEYIGKNKVIGDKDEYNFTQEVKSSTIVNNNYSLSKVLNLPAEIENIAIISTDNINSKTKENTTVKDSIVGITSDGKVIDLSNKLIQDTSRAISGSQNSLQFEAKNHAEYDNSTRSTFKIAGTNNYISVGIGNMGTTQVYISKKTKDNQLVEVEIETNKSARQYSSTRNINKEGKGVYNTDNINLEAKGHTDHKDDKIAIVNADGDMSTYVDCEHKPTLKEIQDNLEVFNSRRDSITDQDVLRNMDIVNCYNENNPDCSLEQFAKMVDKNDQELDDDMSFKEVVEQTKEDNIKDRSQNKKEEKENDGRSLEDDALKRVYGDNY